MNQNKLYPLYIFLVVSLTVFLLGVQVNMKKTGEVIKLPREIERKEGNCTPCQGPGEEPNCPQRWEMSSSNPDLRYVNRPGFKGIYDGNWVCLDPTTVHINSFGLRDTNYSVDKPKEVFRVVALGDSETFGLGVEENESYPEVLEKILNRNGNEKDYQVFNFGTVGYDMTEKVELFEERGIQFEPDLVIVQYHPDDIFLNEKKRKLVRERVEEYKEKTEKSELKQSTKDEIKKRALEGYIDKTMAKSCEKRWESARLKDSLDRLDELAEDVLVFSWSDPSCPGILARETEKRNWSLKIWKRKKPSKKYILSPRDTHPNPRGHELIARELYEKIKDEKLVS